MTTRDAVKNLTTKHDAFLNRLSNDSFRPVPPLTAFAVVGYRRPTDPTPHLAYVPFRIVSADPDQPNPAFDAPRRARDVAAQVRHAAGRVCRDPDAATFVHGHVSDTDSQAVKGDGADDRVLFLPLPTIQPPPLNRVVGIRRVLVAGPVRLAERVRQLARRLEGEELVWENKVQGLLAPLTPDWVLGRYVGAGHAWSTVTPVILPGHDDGNGSKTERLLRRAFVQAGLPPDLIDAVRSDDLAWRNVGFRPGVDLALRYSPPDKLTGQRYHVRVRFPLPVRGPLAVGAGRYRGFGVFALDDKN